MLLLDRIAGDSSGVFLRDFAEEVSYTPAGGTARTERAIVDIASEVLELGEQFSMDGVSASLEMDAAKVPEMAQGDAMVVRSITYKVTGVEPDVGGMLRVRLSL